MIDFKLTGVLLFLVPGLAAYCALYQVFGAVHLGVSDRAKLAPVPPAANSIKALTFVLLWSLAAHAVTTCFIVATRELYTFWPIITLPTWIVDDPYAVTMSGTAYRSTAVLAQLLIGALLQAAISLAIIQWWLRRRVKENSLPRWLYGWPAYLANLVDDDNEVVAVWVLTTTDLPGGALAYSGNLYDLTIKEDGSIGSVSLKDCERYVVDLSTHSFTSNLRSLSIFSNFTIEGHHIRNLTVEILNYDLLVDFNLDDLPDTPVTAPAAPPTPHAR